MGKEVPGPCLRDVDLEDSKLVFGEEFGLEMAAGETILSGSPVLSFMAVEGLAGSKLPSSDLVTHSRSKA